MKKRPQNTQRKCIIILCLMLLCSCEKDELISNPQVAQQENCTSITNPFSISKEDAIATLQDFLISENDDISRASNMRVIKNIYPITSKYLFDHKSRSELDSLNCSDLLYIANFEDNKGYAILAADNRIRKPIIGVVDSIFHGNEPGFDPQPAHNFDWDILGLNRPIYDNYPTDGPGFFTVEEYPNEVFLNPNTVNLYDKEVDDTLVGTYLTEESEISRAGNGESFNIEDYALNLCAAYAVNEVILYNTTHGMGFASKDTLDPRIPGLNYDVTYKTIDVSPWRTLKATTPSLKNYELWYQEGEFNDQYPYRRRFFLFGHNKKAPAGCFPLALAKLMAYYVSPATVVFNKVQIDLALVHDGITYNPKNFKALQSLLYGISQECNSWYFYQGTFTFPWKISSLMEKLGYTDVSRKAYSFSTVKEMINKGCPLIMYGMPDINIQKSHAWNIDGYKIKVRTITKERYEGKNLTNTFTVNDTCKMVHCDFGSGGGANGFYESNVFNPENENTEFDYPGTEIKPFKYNRHLRIIKYNRP